MSNPDIKDKYPVNAVTLVSTLAYSQNELEDFSER